MIKEKIPIILISLSSAASLFIYKVFENPRITFQILLFATVVILIFLKKASLDSLLKYHLFKNILYASCTFFVTLLVISTGGFLSPFFILIHLTTLALSFLFSLQSSIAFLVSSIAITSVHLYYFYPIDYQSVDNVLLVVYILSLVTIVPISFFVARRYDLSNRLANYLNKQLFISQTEKDLLLKSINEGVITVDPNLKIVNLNSIAQGLIKLDENSIRDKFFFDVFSFENRYGAKLKKTDIPFQNLLKLKTTFKKDNVRMIVANGITLQSINFTFSSNIDENGKVIGILFIFSDLTKESQSGQIQNVIEIFFQKFMNLQPDKVKKAMAQLYLLYQFQNDKFNETSLISDIGGIIKKITQNYPDKVNLLFDQKVLSEIKIGNEKRIETTSNVKPLSIVTNPRILENSFYSLINLALDINDKNIPISIDSKLGENEILITIKTNSEIKKDQADEITKPFFGKLENSPQTKNAIGIEGYIAKIFLESIGGSITIEDNNGLIFKVTLPYLRK